MNGSARSCPVISSHKYRYAYMSGSMLYFMSYIVFKLFLFSQTIHLMVHHVHKQYDIKLICTTSRFMIKFQVYILLF